MKSMKSIVAAIALVGLAACCDNSPKQFTGFIADATMNTVTVRAIGTDSLQSFSTDKADMSQANGLLLGAPIVVDYKGALKANIAATKVIVDSTYTEAVGEWLMPDPINDSLKMGFLLQIEGSARSINMATLQYNAWELQGEAGKILLKGQSIGNGQTINFTETGILSKNADGLSTLTIANGAVVLTKTR